MMCLRNLLCVGLGLVAMSGCSSPDFDGLYLVDSYTLSEDSCASAGPEIDRDFFRFQIVERQFAGVTIYPVYPCDDNGQCSEDNAAIWSLVTVEEDLDHVSMTEAASIGNSCLLTSVDLVINGDAERVVLQQRSNEVWIEPYNPATCTTARARAMRDEMQCRALLQLVGVPEAADDGP